MTDALIPPFAIGQRLWLPRAQPIQKTVPCPVCFGKREVTVILGDGEHVVVDCDGCGLGFQGPQGVVEVYDHGAKAIEFVIGKVESFQDGEWAFRSETNDYADASDLRATEAEAIAVAEMKLTELMNHEMNRRRFPKDNLKKLAWTIRYHRDCAAENERKAAYHREKTRALKAAVPVTDVEGCNG